MSAYILNLKRRLETKLVKSIDVEFQIAESPYPPIGRLHLTDNCNGRRYIFLCLRCGNYINLKRKTSDLEKDLWCQGKMECHPVRVNKNQARKRTAQPKTWKVNRAKNLRYSAKSLPIPPKCNHKNESLKCNIVTGKLLRKFHTAFYKHTSKAYQNAILLKCCTAVPVKRKRPRTGSKASKEFSTKFHIIADQQKVPVCQNTFLGALRIKKGRILALVAKSFKTGEFPMDKRGGDHRSHKYTEIQQSIHTFIKKLQCSEPHYCRSQTSVRSYLPSDLNIRKLHKMYKASFPGPYAKESYFRTIFNTQYNLGFGSPQTDICSTCLQLNEKIKLQKDETKKLNLMIQKRVHTLRAKAFFSLLKTEKDVKIMSYDCQKNMALPKLPDQSCYYSRQLYLFNFTIVEGTSKSTLTKNNVFANVWTEDSFAKDSNTISSAVYNRLNNTDLNGIHTIRLIADGCGGQNKNKTMIAMCCKWLLDHPTVKNVELVFPVTGHSYLPADRVFGNTEKRFRKIDTITSPNQYIDIISEQATLVKVGDAFPVYDFKSAAETIIKPPGQWKIKFSRCKRFFIRRSKRKGNVLVNGELFYNTKTGQFENICKKNKTISMLPIDSHILQKGVPVQKLKLRDVNSLLSKHYGTDWRIHDGVYLTFYSQILNPDQNLDNQDEDNDDNEPEEIMCEPQEESPLLII